MGRRRVRDARVEADEAALAAPLARDLDDVPPRTLRQARAVLRAAWAEHDAQPHPQALRLTPRVMAAQEMVSAAERE